MKKFTVDRIEGNKAVLECEDGTFANFDLSALPKNIREGDIIQFNQGSCYLNAEETERRKQKIKKLMDSLFED